MITEVETIEKELYDSNRLNVARQMFSLSPSTSAVKKQSVAMGKEYQFSQTYDEPVGTGQLDQPFGQSLSGVPSTYETDVDALNESSKYNHFNVRSKSEPTDSSASSRDDDESNADETKNDDCCYKQCPCWSLFLVALLVAVAAVAIVLGLFYGLKINEKVLLTTTTTAKSASIATITIPGLTTTLPPVQAKTTTNIITTTKIQVTSTTTTGKTTTSTMSKPAETSHESTERPECQNKAEYNCKEKICKCLPATYGKLCEFLTKCEHITWEDPVECNEQSLSDPILCPIKNRCNGILGNRTTNADTTTPKTVTDLTTENGDTTFDMNETVVSTTHDNLVTKSIYQSTGDLETTLESTINDQSTSNYEVTSEMTTKSETTAEKLDTTLASVANTETMDKESTHLEQTSKNSDSTLNDQTSNDDKTTSWIMETEITSNEESSNTIDKMTSKLDQLTDDPTIHSTKTVETWETTPKADLTLTTHAGIETTTTVEHLCDITCTWHHMVKTETTTSVASTTSSRDWSWWSNTESLKTASESTTTLRQTTSRILDTIVDNKSTSTISFDLKNCKNYSVFDFNTGMCVCHRGTSGDLCENILECNQITEPDPKECAEQDLDDPIYCPLKVRCSSFS